MRGKIAECFLLFQGFLEKLGGLGGCWVEVLEQPIDIELKPIHYLVELLEVVAYLLEVGMFLGEGRSPDQIVLPVEVDCLHVAIIDIETIGYTRRGQTHGLRLGRRAILADIFHQGLEFPCVSYIVINLDILGPLHIHGVRARIMINFLPVSLVDSCVLEY